jgi:hypothetical protein
MDMSATKFCSITLQTNYDSENGHVMLSMPGYVEIALHQFTNSQPKPPQHNGSYQSTEPQYNNSHEDNNLVFDSKCIKVPVIKRLQKVIGTLLFLARAVNNTMLVALSTLATTQTKGIESTMQTLIHLLDYAATHPDAAIRFHKSAMILYNHSDSPYLSEPKARSRVGGYFYLGNPNERTDKPKSNGPIHVESCILKHIMAAASEAEIAVPFHTG